MKRSRGAQDRRPHLALLLALGALGVAVVWRESRPAVRSSVSASVQAPPPAITGGRAVVEAAPTRREQMAELRAELGRNPATATLRVALERCAAHDTCLALELAQSWARDDLERFHLVSAVITNWAPRAPSDALDWAVAHSQRLSLPEEGSLPTIALQAIAAGDPETMRSLVEQRLRERSPAIAPAALADAAVVAWVTTGRAEQACAAVEVWCRAPWSDAVDGESIRVAALALAGRQSAAVAASWLARLPSSADRASALVAVAGEWAEKDPAAALGWAQSLPFPAARADAMARAFDGWADRDAAAAAAWFLAHESLPNADAMIPGFIARSRIAYDEPLVALQWARLVRNDAERAHSQELALRQWAERDRAAALRYLQNDASFSDEQRTRLRSALTDS
jgi:hypothetical protein